MTQQQTRYPAEMRMLREHRDEYASEWAAIKSIGDMLGVHRETLRMWLRRSQVDAGERAGLTSEERERLKRLERETASCDVPTRS